jgi:hypothetical protein
VIPGSIKIVDSPDPRESGALVEAGRATLALQARRLDAQGQAPARRQTGFDLGQQLSTDAATLRGCRDRNPVQVERGCGHGLRAEARVRDGCPRGRVLGDQRLVAIGLLERRRE